VRLVIGKISVAGKNIFTKCPGDVKGTVAATCPAYYVDWRIFVIYNIELICPQLVLKTKYIDTLIKLLLLLTYLLTYLLIIFVLDSPKESVVLMIMARAA